MKPGWLASQSDVDDALLRDSVELIGAQAAAHCNVGQTVKVRGTIRALRLRPTSGTPMLEVEIWDGSGFLTLIWLGRRAIPGINAGRSLVAEGRISRGPSDQPAIYNPRYSLLPAE